MACSLSAQLSGLHVFWGQGPFRLRILVIMVRFSHFINGSVELQILWNDVKIT
jgi:hypothetical protein